MGSFAAAAVLVEEPPEFEFKGGLFYIFEGDTTRVMRPNTFFATVAAAATAGKEFKFGGAEIIEFPPGEPHAASS